MTLADIRQDISKGVMPLLLAITLMIAAASFAFGVGVVFSNLSRDNEEFRKDILGVKADIALVQGQVARVQADLAEMANRWPLGDKWSRSDQVRFCLEAERENDGWTCPTLSQTNYRPQRRKAVK